MPYRVLLTRDAANDLEELDTWIATHDSPERADYVLESISEVLQKLTELPERGTYPRELSVLGIREFREVFFKPYRIIYRVERRTVYVDKGQQFWCSVFKDWRDHYGITPRFGAVGQHGSIALI